MILNIVFIIFNRPEHTRRIAKVLAEARPTRLLVVADGPRPHRPEDAALVQQTRDVIDEIDWQCPVDKNYSDVNMTCTNRVVSGLSWAFSIVEEAIIIEDDIVSDASFFKFCSELLHRYRDDERIGSICGYQPVPDMPCVPESYYFSIYGGIWGWATWRRAWRQYDYHMQEWPQQRKSGWLKRAFPHQPHAARYFAKAWDQMLASSSELSWDFRWVYSIRKRELLCICPKVNLTENIGFGPGATNTLESPERHQVIPSSRMEFPLTHPKRVEWNRKADRVVARIAIPRLPTKGEVALRRFTNVHTYGMYLRKVPWLGKLWATLRQAKGT
jgi:hypothetical protein